MTARSLSLPSLAALSLAFACLGAAAVPVAAQAQTWPERPIRLLVPLAAGSTADIASRTVGAELATALGQSVVVENKPGAGGTIAMAEVARAAPDGYTISFASQGTLVFNQALYSRPGYDSLADFEFITLLGGVSNVMIVHPSNPAKTATDVIAQVKAKADGMTFSSGGSGTSHHLSGVLFGQKTGTKLIHVPYKGAPQGILAVMSGEVDMGFFNTPTVISQVREGRLKALGVTSLEPSSLLPGVPTLDKSGVPGYEVNTWFGFVAPKGTPRPIIERLHKEFTAILARPDLRGKLSGQGFDLAADTSGAGFRALTEADLKQWIPVVRASGAKVD